MKRTYLILIIAILGLSLFNCGNTYDNLATNLYIKSERAAAVASLKTSDQEKAFPYVIKVLGSRDEDSVNAAIEVFQAWDKDTTIKKLKDVFINTDNTVIAQNIVRCLSKIGGQGSEDFLIKLLDDSRLLVQSEAMIGLGELKSKKALEPILKLLTPENLNNPILTSALNSVQEIGDPSSAAPLKQLLDSKINSVSLKINIFRAILSVDPDNAETFCLSKLEISNDIRMISVIVEKLRKVGTKNSIKPLEDLKKQVNGMDKMIDRTIEMIKERSGK
ncbi:HEAT repeat domain-containing protein [bacterium]|nr:HEAT repeat domain-containing protein [bacterium]